MELTYEEFCDIAAGLHDKYHRVQYKSYKNKFERLFFLYNEQLYVIAADARFDGVEDFGGMWATKCVITDFVVDYKNSPRTDGSVLPSDKIEAGVSNG